MIAIHDRRGSFSDRWIEVCSERGIPHVKIDLFADDFFEKLQRFSVSAILSHPPMADRRSAIASLPIIHACTAAGIPIFPRLEEFWHFDDKVAQKYLFEGLGIPTPRTHVFLDRDRALRWLEQTDFPIVFKLRAGAGSVNVSLLKTKKDAIARVNQMFGRGTPATDGALKDVKNKIRLHSEKRDWFATAARLPTTLRTLVESRRNIDWERGYVYFQEFVAGNTHDTRVTIIGNRAFAFRRMTRPGDFRASGSGTIDYDPHAINPDCLLSAFKTAKQLKSSCIAFDFIHRGPSSTPLIVEMSFGFVAKAVFDCPGHWSPELKWQEGHVWPQDAILDDIVQSLS